MNPVFSLPEIHEKGWGRELWIINTSQYCAKILEFNEGAKCSFHYHLLKTETWYIKDGSFHFKYFDLTTGRDYVKCLYANDVVHLKAGIPHLLTCVSKGSIFETSTQHFEPDSYRIEPGDSQK